MKAGTTDWQLTNPALNNEITGYASLTSVNRGGQISLYVNSNDPTYTIDIFRMGYYGFAGGRRMMSTITLSRTAQPACPQDATTGMTECQWINSYVLTVPGDPNDPTNWASGIYLAKLTGQSSGKQSYIIFVVRDDARPSQFLFVQNVTTYQAYNYWGGKSLYSYNSTNSAAAVKVSYNRPYAVGPQAGAGYGVGAGEFLTNYAPNGETYPAAWEYNAVRWLEQEGYDVTYATSVDLHEQANLLLKHAAYLSFGHNEYWSMAMRTNVTNARDNGVNLGFFGANTLYWQIRFESSLVTDQADRTEVCYKSTSDPVTGPTQTLQWRNLNPPQPEAALVGVMYRHDPVQSDIVVQNTSNWVFQGTGLTDGAHLQGLLGYEVDSTDSSSPAGTIPLGNSPYLSHMPARYSNMSVYTAASGATVFATGSIQWAWGLDDYNSTALRPSFLNPVVEQITKNVLTRFTTIGVKVTPTNVNLRARQSQAFNAIVTGTTLRDVTWSMSSTFGTLISGGMYSAPSDVSSPRTVTITATSVADGETQGWARISFGLPPTEEMKPEIPAHADAGGGTALSVITGFSGGDLDSTTATTDNSGGQKKFSGNETLTTTVPPTITTQPTNQEVTIGRTATFTVVATGSPALSFQWRKDEVNIGGATASSYTTPATVKRDNGSIFDVVVSNTAGSVTSSTASLTVNAPPAAVSVTPNNGHSSLSQAFRFVYSNPNGFADLSEVHIWFTANGVDANSCYIKYLRKASGLYLHDDAGTSFVGPVTLGSAVMLQNSQCGVDAGSSSVFASGNDLKLTLSVKFTISYAATQTVRMYAADYAGRTTGWISVGTWTPVSSLPRRRAR